LPCIFKMQGKSPDFQLKLKIFDPQFSP